MKPRFVIIIVAVILGAVATLGVNVYLNNIRKQAVEEQKTVNVLVANQDIEKGTSIEDILTNHLADLKEVPQRYLAAQSLSSTRTVEGQVLSMPISMGEQLTINKFKYPSEAGLSFSVPKGFIAVSIPYDDVRGVAGMVKPGDLITVFATLNPGPDGENITKILLQKVQVIAIGVRIGTEKDNPNNQALKTAQSSSDSASDSKRTVTLALTPVDAERLIYTQENGKIWFGLHPSTNAEAVVTEGKTLKSVFK